MAKAEAKKPANGEKRKRGRTKSAHALTGSERVALLHLRAQDVKESVDKARKKISKKTRAQCERDLVLFGVTYCRAFLKHPPSDLMVEAFIRPLQNNILGGGQTVVEFPRGTGKTTWIKIAVTWSLLYGHRRFPVVLAATGKMAADILKQVRRVFMSSEELMRDWPDICLPVRAIGNVTQRCMSQTYGGTPTDIEIKNDHVTLPTILDKNGKPREAACGSVIGAVGMGGSVRGLVDMALRPDMLFIDDPQRQRDAKSRSTVRRLEEFIMGDAMGLAGHTETMSAIAAVTPICYGDLVTRLTSKEDHPEWHVLRQSYVVKWPPNRDDLLGEFRDAYRADAASSDFAWTQSTQWYRENRERFAGMQVIDPLNFDERREVDAVHHVLNIWAKSDERTFNAEYQMVVEDVGSELVLTADQVAHALNGAPMFELPPGTRAAVAYCDLNIKSDTGLSCVLLACGTNRVTAVPGYFRHPKRGRVVPANASETETERAIAKAIGEVVRIVKETPLHVAGSSRTVPVVALCFDGGWATSVVARTVYAIRKTQPLPFKLCWSRGFGWQQFRDRGRNSIQAGDHIFASSGPNGEYLAIHAPYWREIAQKSLLAPPLTAGSCSLFGSAAVRHWDFASEVAAERLVRKYLHPSGLMAWDWETTGPNHYGDALTGCFAIASWFRLYDALPAVVDSVAVVAASEADNRERPSKPVMARPKAKTRRFIRPRGIR